MPRLTYLDRDYVENIAHRLAEALFTGYGDPLPAFQLIGGGSGDGASLLESALGLPPQPYYRTLHDKAGVLLRSLIKNHPLVDGNKRVAMTATYVFLAFNGHMLFASNREMVDFALQIASDKPDMEWKQVAAWLKGRTIKATAKTEDIQARLDKFSGEWRDPQRVGSRLAEYHQALLAVQKEAGG